MSVTSSIRARALNNFIQKEKERIIRYFAANVANAASPATEQRAITKVTKRILLDAPYLLNGRSWNVKAKSLGAGVYKLTLEKEEE